MVGDEDYAAPPAMAKVMHDGIAGSTLTVIPKARSYYRWKGQVEAAEEWLLLIKSSRERFEALRAEMEKHHPYELPELLALPVVAGAANYLNWVEANLGAGE